MTNKTYGIDYNNGKIYKIVCNITGKIYVGSTTKQYLSQRLTWHRNDYRRYLKNNNLYITTSYQVLENGSFNIILLENVPCSNRDELRARERYYIETLDCVNKCIPGRTRREYNFLKFDCKCGGQYMNNKKHRHFRTKKHIDYISKSENITTII